MKALFVMIAGALFSFQVSAQKTEIKFHSINQMGLLMGEKEASLALQSVNGIRFSNWFAGLGVGYDRYSYKSVPVFLDGRRYFGNGNKAFGYLDLGYNAALKNAPGNEVAFYDSYRFTGGIYTDIGLGYQFNLGKISSVLISLGRSYKQIKIRTSATYPCLIAPCPEEVNNYNEGFGRWILKAGIDLK